MFKTHLVHFGGIFDKRLHRFNAPQHKRVPLKKWGRPGAQGAPGTFREKSAQNYTGVRVRILVKF
jgi:hypothetical protein